VVEWGGMGNPRKECPQEWGHGSLKGRSTAGFPERRGGAEQNRPAFRQSGERRIHNGMIRVIAPRDSEQNIAIDQMARRRHYA
jgi:hypothetical protein